MHGQRMRKGMWSFCLYIKKKNYRVGNLARAHRTPFLNRIWNRRHKSFFNRIREGGHKSYHNFLKSPPQPLNSEGMLTAPLTKTTSPSSCKILLGRETSSCIPPCPPTSRPLPHFLSHF